MKYLVEALKGMSIDPVADPGVSEQLAGFHRGSRSPSRSRGADVMATYMFDTDQGIFAKQLRQLGVTPTWVGSPSTVTTTALKLAGAALYGSYAVADFNKDSSAAAKAFSAKYEAAYKFPADFYASWTYDALQVLAAAIGEAKNLEPESSARPFSP